MQEPQNQSGTPQKDPLYKPEVSGAPKDRRDGVAKVTGGAKYSAEYNLENRAYAALAGSSVSRGTLTAVDTRAAEALPGVLKVYTPFNVPKANPIPPQQGGSNPTSNVSKAPGPLEEKEIHHFGQYIAVVIADTLEIARHGVSLLRAEYRTEKPAADPERVRTSDPKGKVANKYDKDTVRGNPDKAMRGTPVKLDQSYTTPFENHNPIEPHATVVDWKPDMVTIYDATQYTYGVRDTMARQFGLQPENVRVVTPYVGGAFGCKGTAWPHVAIAVLCAREVGRPVKLAIEREQMFTNVGGRAMTDQHIQFGAQRDGNIQSFIHEGHSSSAEYQEYVESFTAAPRMMIDVADARFSQRLKNINMVVPTYMRAPGEVTGMYAFESALDELAWELGMDPIELRERNEPKIDPGEKVPFSSRNLIPSLRQAAERFGWSRRNPKPRSMREGNLLIGMGCSSATYPVNHFASNAKATITKDGMLTVAASAHEIGTGTQTAQAQLAADFAGLPYERVVCKYGDTMLPYSGVAGGSATMGSFGTAIHSAVRNLQAKMLELLATNPSSPLYGEEATRAAAALRISAQTGSETPGGPKAQVPTGTPADAPEIADLIVIGEGRIALKSDPSKYETYESALARLGVDKMEADGKFSPPQRGEKPTRSMHSFGANFCEVTVDEDLGSIRVRRYVAAYAAGRVMNMKTGVSQFKGGVVMGIGMALEEETVIDPRDARYVNRNLAEYHVPVNLDIPEIEIIVLPEEDKFVNPMGTKGIGEIGIVGAAAAVANAVYHATGKRVRDLPITLDKLL